MDLVTLDHPDHGGSGVLTTQPGHVEVFRTPSFKRWSTGIPHQFRVGGGVGPCHYPSDGPWDLQPGREMDAWPEIDLRAGLSARAGVRAAVSRCGYACDWGDDYGLTVRRGGVAVHLVPVALAWVNDRGQQQIIATPTPGRPVVVDDAGLWALDAFGPGIDYGARLWPDMLRPAIRVNNPAALFVGLNRPTIDPTGLRLAKVLNVGYDGGQPDRDLLFRQSRFRRQARATHLTGRADETRRDPGKIPVRHTRGDALWFGEARAWDDEQGWALRQDWRRYGDDVTVALSLAAEDVASAVGPLCLDTTMTEQQVGAGADDGGAYGASDWNAGGVLISVGNNGGTIYNGWFRWASVPLPQGCTVDTATASLRAAGANSGATTSLDVAFNDVDSAARITTRAGYNALALTSALSWPSVASWASGSWYSTPDLSAQVQAVKARAGSADGSAMAAVVRDAGSSTSAYRRASAYEVNATYSAKLNATYTEAAAGGQPYALRIAGIPHMGRTGFRPGRGW